MWKRGLSNCTHIHVKFCYRFGLSTDIRVRYNIISKNIQTIKCIGTSYFKCVFAKILYPLKQLFRYIYHWFHTDMFKRSAILYISDKANTNNDCQLKVNLKSNKTLHFNLNQIRNERKPWRYFWLGTDIFYKKYWVKASIPRRWGWTKYVHLIHPTYCGHVDTWDVVYN